MVTTQTNQGPVSKYPLGIDDMHQDFLDCPFTLRIPVIVLIGGDSIEITPGLLRVPVKYSKEFTRLHQVNIMLKIRVVFVYIRSVHDLNIEYIM